MEWKWNTTSTTTTTTTTTTTFVFFSVLAVSILILLQVKLAAQRSQKENLWGLLKHDVLHHECPSCCSAKSIQALTGLNNTTAVI